MFNARDTFSITIQGSIAEINEARDKIKSVLGKCQACKKFRHDLGRIECGDAEYSNKKRSIFPDKVKK